MSSKPNINGLRLPLDPAHTQKIQGILLGCIAACLPLLPKIVPVFIILITANALLQKSVGKRFRQMKATGFMYAMTGFYGLHVIGMLYSDNLAFGLFDLEIKLSLLLFPLIFALSPALNKRQFLYALWAFIIACAIAVVIGLVSSYQEYRAHDEKIIYFYGPHFYPFMHLGFFALYLNFAIACVMHLMDNYRLSWKDPGFYGLWLGILLLVSGVWFTTSKIGLLSLLLLLLIALTYWVITYRRWIAGLLCLLILAASLWAVTTQTSETATYLRFESAIQNLLEPVPERSMTGSIQSRKQIWRLSTYLIRRHPLLGTGTGDVKDELLRTYDKLGYTGLKEKQLNAHNQFIQTTVALGIAGLLGWLSLLGIPLIRAIRRRELLLGLLVILLAAAALTDSIIEVQAGVVFLALFLTLLMHRPSRTDSSKN